MTINILDIEFEDYLEEINEIKELLYRKFNFVSQVERKRIKAKEEAKKNEKRLQ